MNLIDCFNYYPFSIFTKVAVVEILGDIDRARDDDYSEKCCTNKIRIVKELKWDEVLRMLNIGEENNGMGNTGYHNIGNRNTYNFSDGNIGAFNIETPKILMFDKPTDWTLKD